MLVNINLIDRFRTFILRNAIIKNIIKTIFGPFLSLLENNKIAMYNTWLRNQLPTEAILEKQRQISKNINYRPTISVIVPVYEPPKKFFIEMVESVIRQSYDNWELILVDDASPSEWVKRQIQEYTTKDKRIKYKFLTSNLHIAGATNEGIKAAKGEFVALLDNDDILQPNALFEVVTALNKNPKLQLIYSDEDKIEGETGVHLSPYFKPSWNPDFLYSVNYITHLAVIEKKILKEIGGSDGKYNGAQDWELFLRIARTINHENIYHIPKVLYSWRIHQASTASGIEAKPYVVEAQRNAIESDLNAKGYKGYFLEQDDLYPAQWHINFPIIETSTVHIILENSKQLNTLNSLIAMSGMGALYSVSLKKGTDLNAKLLESIKADYLLYIPDGYTVRNLRFIDAFIQDAQRPGIGFVSSRYKDTSSIMKNIQSLVSPDALDYIKKTSVRDITKHFYSSTRYNIPFVLPEACFCIEIKKVSKNLTESSNESLYELAMHSEHYRCRNLYNPYISLL